MSLSIALHADGQSLTIHIPGNLDGWDVRIPLTEQGLITLRHILMERDVTPSAKIGTPAAPLQNIIDAWLTGHKVTRVPVRESASRREIAELDLDIDL